MVTAASTTALAVVFAVHATSALSKTPVYVVLRMDDTQHTFDAATQKAVLDWAIENKVKYNVGVIAGPGSAGGQPWPTACAADSHTEPSAGLCTDPIVSALNKAYESGLVRGNPVVDASTGEPSEPLIEIFDHSWAHNDWTWQAIAAEDFQKNDFAQSRQALCNAYPKASIRTFVPPTNIANAATVEHMREYGLDILSSQGTGRKCPSEPGPPGPPHPPGPGPPDPAPWVYDYTPCQAQPHTPGSYTCVPPNGQYVASDGTWNTLQGHPIWSVPTGSANSLFFPDDQGLSVEDAIGKDDECGCVGQETCSIIGGARFNAHFSNNLMWTVVMMHPQTKFGESLTYVSWLTQMLERLRAHSKYDFQFVHFQDLAYMKNNTPGAGATPAPDNGNYVCVPASPPPPPSPPGKSTTAAIAAVVCGGLFGALVLAVGGRSWLRQRSRARAAAAARAMAGHGSGDGLDVESGADTDDAARERLLPAHAPATSAGESPRAGGAHGVDAAVHAAVPPHVYGRGFDDSSCPPGAPPSTGWSLHGHGHSSQGFDSLPPGQPPADMTLTRAMPVPKPKPKPKRKPPTFTLKTRDVHKYSVGQHVNGVGKDGKLSGIIVKLERDLASRNRRAGVMTVQPPTPA